MHPEHRHLTYGTDVKAIEAKHRHAAPHLFSDNETFLSAEG
jgi:hypothetical protein